MVLRMCLRVPSALEPAQGRSGYASSGKMPAKMTAARRRVLEILKEARIAARLNELDNRAVAAVALGKSPTTRHTGTPEIPLARAGSPSIW